MRRVIPVLLAALAFAAEPGYSETFMLYMEEWRDGSAAVPPLSGLEGLMSGMFDAGHVTFDTGPYVPEADWETRQFGEPLAIAREGGAHYLATARIVAQSEAGEDPAGWPLVKARILFYLWSARTASLLAQGELEMDNRGREKELPYGALLFQLGERAAWELSRLAEQLILR